MFKKKKTKLLLSSRSPAGGLTRLRSYVNNCTLVHKNGDILDMHLTCMYTCFIRMPWLVIWPEYFWLREHFFSCHRWIDSTFETRGKFKKRREIHSHPRKKNKQNAETFFKLKSWPYCEKTNKIGALDCKSEKSSKKKKTKNSQSLKTFSQFDNEWILPVMVNLVDPERVSISVNKFSIRVCTWLMTCVHFSFWPHFFLFFFSFFYLEKMNGMFVVCVCLWN